MSAAKACAQCSAVTGLVDARLLLCFVFQCSVQRPVQRTAPRLLMRQTLPICKWVFAHLPSVRDLRT